ncbi:CheR family methyltransferase [Enhydrobacter aerosaccus]|nr:CheR family methyltransferase [Enhydrobacter aerosaccus]
MARSEASGGAPVADDAAPLPVVPIVGIGASAGGLTALEMLLPPIKPGSGLAYVVIQHLDPDHESALPSLLERSTALPVAVITNGMAIEADRIYVLPPNAGVAIEDDRLRLAELPRPRGPQTPIDGFFTSLAEARGERAAAVILSGSGSDGTLGLRAIKEHGGLTIAQRGAEYDGMMRSAVQTGMVDVVLPVAEIPAKLADYFRDLDRRKSQAEGQGARDALTQILALLRARTGHDFSGYKDRTVARRVQRRMQVLQIDTVATFIERLRKDPQEVDLLLQDLLIGVTNFFRDPQAFAALEEKVIPYLFEGKGPNDTIRIWVPGCSTGEEAYSIAILLREHLPKGQAGPRLQIFASDIDEQALQTARIGRYPAAIAGDVAPERLEQHFVREDGTYRIASDLREICLFSAHNLLHDAPFSKLDLISCRNLLIYLTPELQNRVIPLFHYALNESGYLFLGSSENLTRHARLFSTLDKPHRIFRRRTPIERRLPEFPLTTTEGARHRTPAAQRIVADPDSLQSLAERQLLERYSPAYVVINAEGDALHGSGRTGKYLELAPGAPKIDVFSMARQGLRPDMRAGVHKAASTGQVVVQKNVIVGTNGGRQTIDLIVQPLRTAPAHDPLYMIVFQDIGGIKNGQEANGAVDDEDLESAGLRQLETELRATKERLQTTTEELESTNEELKSGNEELSSMNEELQSANEELETSKEELQSINEELQTVNAELNSRVEDLSRANSDIANLLESTQIATLFLDRDLNVKSFTPAAKDVFRLIESDMGRPITHVRACFKADTVQDDAERVLRTLSTIERQIEGADNGARYVMRMMPYRTVDNVIAGVVITFVDVTKMSAAEARINQLTRDLRDRIQSLEILLDVVPVGILILQDRQKIDEIRVNRYGAQLLGHGAQGEAGSGPRLLSAGVRLFQGDRELPPDEQPLQLSTRSGHAVANFEGQLLRPDGERRDVMITSTPLFDDAGKTRGGIAAIVDISERKNAEARQQILLYELQHRVKNIIATVSALANRSLPTEGPMAAIGEAFQGRLRGMAATHELLSRANWRGAPLAELIEAATRSLTGFEGSNVDVHGPDVLMTPAAAATLGMVFYELATNAVKYGALSKSGGRVDIDWQVTGSPTIKTLSLTWTESGSKPIAPDARAGFGMTFIKRSIEYELAGKADMEPTADGLRWKMDLPFAQNVQHA